MLISWHRVLSLLVFAIYMIVVIAQTSVNIGYFFWAAMSLAFIWWTDEMADVVNVPVPVLRFMAWGMLLLPVIVGIIVASVN